MYRLFWMVDMSTRPTMHNLFQSFEGWAYQNGYLSQIYRLEAQGYIESVKDAKSGKRLHRLTEAGRAVARGGRDPEAAWATRWDRQWRLFLFDVPERERAKRRELTRALAGAGCGRLQGSVWIAAITPKTIEKMIVEKDEDCSHLLLLQADSKGRKEDARMVEAAWDFNLINKAYQELLEVLERFPGIAKKHTRDALAAWTEAEHRATREAMAKDPLLPAELLPKQYMGRKVWKKRKKVLAEAAQLAVSLAP